MRVTAVAREIRERLRHERRAQSVLLRDRLHHELEEGVLVGSSQAIVVFPIHLELAVRVLVIVLIRAPAERDHGVANLLDHIVAPHKCLLVVARLGLEVGRIGDRCAVGRDQEVLALDSRLHFHAVTRRFRNDTLQHLTWILIDGLSIHDEIARHPGNLRLPGKLDDSLWIRRHEHIGMRRGHVEPSGEAGKTGAGLRHAVDRSRRNDLGAHRAEEIHERDQEVLDPLYLRVL